MKIARVIHGERLGRVFRAVRLRLRVRQIDVAARAGVSAGAVSRIERGRLDQVSLTKLARVADVLEIRLEVIARWRGGDLDRMLNAAHAALAEDVVAWIAGQPGWEVRPEVSFNVYAERGVIDLLAWHAATRTLLVIELKTDIVDVNDLVGSMDRRRRLAWSIARERGWDPLTVSTWVLVAASRTNRSRLVAHRTVLRNAFPADGRAMNRWLRQPSSEVYGMSLWDRGVGRHFAARQRVRSKKVTAA